MYNCINKLLIVKWKGIQQKPTQLKYSVSHETWKLRDDFKYSYKQLNLSCIFILSIPLLIKFPINPWLHDWLINLDIQFPTILPS